MCDIFRKIMVALLAAKTRNVNYLENGLASFG
jgi:hypothetical protein